jgi:hypothetical protein
MSIVPVQQSLDGMEQYRREPSTMEMIQEVIRTGGDPVQMATVIKELVALRQSEERFAWEREERQSKISFDEALNRCQAKIGRIAPNVNRKDTGSWWADYAQLDRTIRPIYTGEGFSVAYSEVQPIAAGKVRIRAELSRGGVSKEYFSEITPSTTGAKGNALVNATDADAIAQSRAKRYLLIDIFNISVGIDKEEKKGVPDQPTEEQEVRLQEWADSLRECGDLNQLKGIFADAYKYAKSVGDKSKGEMSRVYEECKRRLI